MTSVKESRAALAVLIVLGGTLGSFLALASFSALRSKGMDALFASLIAAMAFFLGFILVSTVVRIVFGVMYLWRRRR